MRVALRKHPNGRARLAAVDVPTFCGAIRVTGVGDVFSDALGRAVKIASRIVDDPLVRAIMPPQGVIAIDALRDIAGASQMGPDALHDVLATYQGPGQQRLIAALAKEQGASSVGPSGASADNMYRGVGPAPTRKGVGAPPIAGQSSRGSSVSVSNTNQGGGRIAPPRPGTSGAYARDRGMATDQRSTAPEGFIPGKGWVDDRYRDAYFNSLRITDKSGAEARDRLTANTDTSQAATDAETWHPGDFMPPPTPGRAISDEYYQTLVNEAADPSNPYAQDPQYADFYAQLQAENPDMFEDPYAYDPNAYDPYGGGGYAYPDNSFAPPQYPYGPTAEDDMGERWDADQAQASYLNDLVEQDA